MRFELDYPIMVPGQDGKLMEVSSLEMGRFKAKHLKSMPDSMFDDGGVTVKPADMIPLIAALTGISEESAEELDFADLMKIGVELGNFLSASLQTGEGSSSE